MRQLLKAGAHFGHQTRYWSPKMAPYIFGARNKIHIINLDKTLPMLKEAMNYLGAVAAQGGKVLFVGTKRQAGKLIREQAIRCGSPYVDYRWLGGMLTNFKTVKNSIARLKDLEQRFESGATNRLSKKEALTLERERTKLDKTLSGIKDMGGLPKALFIIDVEEEYIAVAEARKLGIPVVAVVDSNCSVEGIDYIIPGNDDSSRAISLYLESVANAILDAREVIKPIPMAAVEGDDEYIELDETGAVITPAKPRAAKTAVKVKPKSTKPVVKEATAEEPIAEEATAEEPAQVEPAKLVDEKPADETPVAADEDVAPSGQEAEKSAAAEADSKSAEGDVTEESADKEEVKKKVSKKKVVRKKKVASEG